MKTKTYIQDAITFSCDSCEVETVILLSQCGEQEKCDGCGELHELDTNPRRLNSEEV